MYQETVVAKFGGSSMAHPNLVSQRITEAEHSPSVVVVSAAGKDEMCDQKMTDMLLAYESGRKDDGRQRVLSRLTDVALRTQLPMRDADQFIEQADSELDDFLDRSAPIAALGERWSARLLAQVTGREYVEAAEVVRFDDAGRVDLHVTQQLMHQRMKNTEGQYVMPGFYGATRDGEIRTFDRGGSDVSGALCALALQATEYQNWSDVDGFYTANPREIAAARPIAELTYREARELANGGSELLHREVGRYLVGSGIPTRMFSTMNGQSRTIVTDQRDTSRMPLIGVGGTRHMIELSHDEFGSEEQAGTSVTLYETLKRHEIPYVHSATSTDTVSIYIDGKYINEVKAAFADDAIEQVSALHIVGQRLIETPLERTKVLGELATTLMQRGIALKGFTDAGRSPATTLFVDTTEYDAALESVNHYIAH